MTSQPYGSGSRLLWRQYHSPSNKKHDKGERGPKIGWYYFWCNFLEVGKSIFQKNFLFYFQIAIDKIAVYKILARYGYTVLLFFIVILKTSLLRHRGLETWTAFFSGVSFRRCELNKIMADLCTTLQMQETY